MQRNYDYLVVKVDELCENDSFFIGKTEQGTNLEATVQHAFSNTFI